MNSCDYGHQTPAEIRVLPVGGGGNALLCHRHYLVEMDFRRYRNRDLDDACKFDLPAWEDLEVYEWEIAE